MRVRVFTSRDGRPLKPSPYMRQNLCDLLKFIFTINVLFRLLSKLELHPTIQFTSNCSFKSFSFLYVKVSFNDGTDYWSCSLYFILTLQTNISTFYAHHVTQERGGGGEGERLLLVLIFAGYVPLASQNPYPIVYSVAKHRTHVTHFWENVIFAIPT